MCEEPKIFNNLKVYNRMINIIINNTPHKPIRDLGIINKKNTIKLAHIYFKEEDPEYNIMLKKLLEKNKIKFCKGDSNYNYKTGKIEIYYSKTLDDLFALIHEFCHFIISSDNNTNITYLFKEVFPNSEEYRLYEYLKKTNLSFESRLVIDNFLSDKYSLAKVARFELKLYKIIKQYGDINCNDISGELRDYFLQKRYSIDNINLEVLGKYLLACILATYINWYLNNNKISLDDYKYLRNNINLLNLDEINDLLNTRIELEDGSLVITDHELNRLEKIYKMEMKYLSAK